MKLKTPLTALAALLGPRPAAVTREVSKLHEEVVDGTLDALAEHLGRHLDVNALLDIAKSRPSAS
jgi:16S rRNA C1402 (ribose-2'-O) methylase RsmI